MLGENWMAGSPDRATLTVSAWLSLAGPVGTETVPVSRLLLLVT